MHHNFEDSIIVWMQQNTIEVNIYVFIGFDGCLLRKYFDGGTDMIDIFQSSLL